MEIAARKSEPNSPAHSFRPKLTNRGKPPTISATYRGTFANDRAPMGVKRKSKCATIPAAVSRAMILVPCSDASRRYNLGEDAFVMETGGWDEGPATGSVVGVRLETIALYAASFRPPTPESAEAYPRSRSLRVWQRCSPENAKFITATSDARHSLRMPIA